MLSILELVIQYVKKVGSGYAVFSKDSGKQLSKVYGTRAQALKRLRQIEFFKHKGQ